MSDEARQRAVDAYVRARDAYAGGQLQQALDAASEAFQALPNASTALIRATILGAMGFDPQAVAAYLQTRDLDPVANELQLIEQGLAKHGSLQAPPVGWLRVQCLPPDVQLEVDGYPIPNRRTVGLAAGQHQVRVRGQDGVELSEAVEVVAGQGGTWARTLPAAHIEPPVVPPDEPAVTGTPGDGLDIAAQSATGSAELTSIQIAAWTLLASGLAVAGGGAGLHAWALDAAADAERYRRPQAGMSDETRKTRFDRARQDAEAGRAGTGVLYAVGAAAVATSLVLFIIEIVDVIGSDGGGRATPADEPAPAEAGVLVPTGVPGGMGVVWHARF